MIQAIDSRDELICLGHDEDLEARDGAMMPPVVQTSLFSKPDFQSLVDGLAAEHENRMYTRGRNPTVQVLEGKMAALERGEAAKCFGSGMGAICAVMTGILAAGDHVLFVNHTYGPTLQLARHLERFGVSHTYLPKGDPVSVEAALQANTKMLYLESPGTMLMGQIPIAELARLARAKGILSVIDNTWATPLFQKPITLGVDLVIHSCAKYLGGHSDVMGGVVVGSKVLLDDIFYKSFLLNGAAPAPFDAWLVIRGLRTLPARLRAHSQSALDLAHFLADHPMVAKVYHPALAENLYEDQLTGYSGLFSIALKRDEYGDVCRFIDGLQKFLIGVSWGGVESLVISPRREDNRAALEAQGIPAGLVRLSIGLEGTEVLREDLAQALHSLELS